VLDALACREEALTIREAADALGRPVAETGDALDVLTGRGLVLASREEPETRLRVPNLLRMLLAANGTEVS
jgi:DNA-binding IclR family transcriptional regulator